MFPQTRAEDGRGRQFLGSAASGCNPSTGRRGMAQRTFKIVLIKPSHYDRDGYVIQWWRSGIPSNSLASLHGLLTECARAKVLGPKVEIDIDGCDECNTLVDVKGAIRAIRAAGSGFIGL